MKFTFTQASIHRSLQRVMGAVPVRMPMPSLGNIFFRLKDGSLDITATDLEITITSKVEIIESEGDGSVLIQAKRLQELVSKLPDVPLEVEVHEGRKVTLNCEGVGVYTLPGGDPMDFPELPSVEAKINFKISGEFLKRLISKTVFAVSRDDMRPILTGILMQIRSNELRVVATDGHRLSRIIRRGIEFSGEARDVVIPMKALNLLTRSLDDADEPEIGIAETRAYFYTEHQRLITRLIDGHYPKYESVIPDDNPYKMTVNADEFMATVGRVSIFANQISHQVKLSISDMDMKLETEDPELGGRGEEKIAIDYSGEPLEIAYNSSYLIDVLRQIDTEEVVFALKSTNDAAVVTATGQQEDEDHLMLLMPIRLK
ncbi:DNA polymerase III subunit beta [bacterium]|nr:DNA polymerase III subunit beta [bacterium]